MKQPTPKTDRLRELREAKHSGSVYSKGRTVRKPDGSPVTAGDLKVGGLYEIDLNTATIKPTKAEKLATAKKAVTNVTNTAKPSPSERSLKWRSENPERYKQTQRELMRKKRKSNATPQA